MSIVVRGDAAYIADNEFRPRVQSCLELLRTKAGAYHTWLLKYDLTVRAAARSGANFSDDAIDIARSTFDASETWLASVLIHEAIHFWQYRDGHYESGTPAETEANLYQLCVLRLLGAPGAEITHMLRQDGGHADLNGDGVYDWRDYELRRY